MPTITISEAGEYGEIDFGQNPINIVVELWGSGGQGGDSDLDDCGGGGGGGYCKFSPTAEAIQDMITNAVPFVGYYYIARGDTESGSTSFTLGTVDVPVSQGGRGGDTTGGVGGSVENQYNCNILVQYTGGNGGNHTHNDINSSGSGGGSSAGPSSDGNDGEEGGSTAGTAGAGGEAVFEGGAGGAGGDSSEFGNPGSSPGGGGGGSGNQGPLGRSAGGNGQIRATWSVGSSGNLASKFSLLSATNLLKGLRWLLVLV